MYSIRIFISAIYRFGALCFYSKKLMMFLLMMLVLHFCWLFVSYYIIMNHWDIKKINVEKTKILFSQENGKQKDGLLVKSYSCSKSPICFHMFFDRISWWCGSGWKMAVFVAVVVRNCSPNNFNKRCLSKQTFGAMKQILIQLYYDMINSGSLLTHTSQTTKKASVYAVSAANTRPLRTISLANMEWISFLSKYLQQCNVETPKGCNNNCFDIFYFLTLVSFFYQNVKKSN